MQCVPGITGELDGSGEPSPKAAEHFFEIVRSLFFGVDSDLFEDDTRGKTDPVLIGFHL